MKINFKNFPIWRKFAFRIKPPIFPLKIKGEKEEVIGFSEIGIKKILLVFLSGLLICFSFPKWNFWFLAWMALVPMFLSVEKLGFWKSFFLGWFTGWAAFCGILYWIVPTFRAAGVHTIIGILSVALLSAYLGIYFGLFAAISEKFFKSFSKSIYILLCAALWVFLEYLRAHLFTGFPWGLLGYSQWKVLPVIQISEWTGVYGVSFLIVLINAFLVLVLNALVKKSFSIDVFRIGAFSVLLFLASILFGYYRLTNDLSRLPAGRLPLTTLSVAVLQGNIDQYKKWSSEYVKEILDTYEKLSGKVIHVDSTFRNFNLIPSPLRGEGEDEGENVGKITSPHLNPLPQGERKVGMMKSAPNLKSGSIDLIVWPETSVPGWVPQEEWLMKWIEKNVKQTGCYNLIGAVTRVENESCNSAFIFDSNGEIIGRYDKIHLVPFGEYVPFQTLMGRWIDVLNQLGGFDSGGNLKILDIPKAKLGVSICYEAIFPGLIRRQVAKGAEILVNITNDGWYLDTAAPEQHFTMNIFRAVENRRYLIRAANTGISGIIKPDGSLQEISKLNQETILSGTVIPNKEKTFYTRFGDLFAWLCFAMSAMGILFRKQGKEKVYENL